MRGPLLAPRRALSLLRVIGRPPATQRLAPMKFTHNSNLTRAAVDRILDALADTKFADRAASINRSIMLSRLRACAALFDRHSDPSKRLTKAGITNLRALKELLDNEVTRRTLEYTGCDMDAVESLREHLAGYLYFDEKPGAINPKEQLIDADLVRTISPKEYLVGVGLADVWRELFGAEPTRSYDSSKQGGARYRPTPFAKFVSVTLIEMGEPPPSYSQIAQCVRDKGQRRASRDRKPKRER